MNQTSIIKYEVRYTCPEVRGIAVLPMWIESTENPMEYARKQLSQICKDEFDIENIRIPISDMFYKPDFELDRKYANRIIEALAAQ